MNRERLLHAIKIMERVRDERLPFDMDDWFENVADPLDCGTAACFLGWCARDPDFNKQGLVFFANPYKPSLRNIFVIAEFASGDPSFFDCAAGAFFDIELRLVRYLAEPSEYDEWLNFETITPDAVIERIREILAEDA